MTRHGYSQMGLTCAGAADQYDIAVCIQETALVKRSHLCFIDFRGAEVKTVYVFVYRKPCYAQPIADASGRAFSQFSFHKIQQYLFRSTSLLYSGGQHFVENCLHAMQVQVIHSVEEFIPQHRHLL